MAQITTELVEELVYSQFPKFSKLPITPVVQGGHDNRTFHLGNKLTVRVPVNGTYASQIYKEAEWLPVLKKQLSLAITSPVAKGKPAFGYPYHWSINNYIAGESLHRGKLTNLHQLAADLANFLAELQRVNVCNAPPAGTHSFYRGGDLGIYHIETEFTLSLLKEHLPVNLLKAIWFEAMETKWNKPPVWLHGDFAPGNIILNNGRLAGVIDFGMMAVGDPACDLAIAWTFFDAPGSEVFLDRFRGDENTIKRAKGWALWKALITYNDKDEKIASDARYTISRLLNQR